MSAQHLTCLDYHALEQVKLRHKKSTISLINIY